VKRLTVAAAAVACSVGIGADDYDKLSASCIGLDKEGMSLCMQLIARHQFGALPTAHDLTLAEKTAVNAILAADSKSFLIIMADGSFVVGQRVSDRLIAIPCDANPCSRTPAKR
jgi:hypothetical protein